MITINNELRRVTTKSGRVISAGSMLGHEQVVLNLTDGFQHGGFDVTVDGPLVEVQVFRGEIEEACEVEHILWSAVESVVWKGDLA